MNPSDSAGHLDHPDLDALADLLAEESTEENGHLASCAGCRDALAELRSASVTVTAELRALPPLAMPSELATGLERTLRVGTSGVSREDEGRARDAGDQAGRASGASMTTLPLSSANLQSKESAERWPGRWVAVAAGVALLLAGVGYGISRTGGGGGKQTTASASRADSARSPAGFVRNDTGANYTGRASLAAALPALLAGSAAPDRAAAAGGGAVGSASQPNDAAPNGAAPNATAPNAAAPKNAAPNHTAPLTGAGINPQVPAADALARLRTPAGLADCLVALLPPDDPSVRPLALDYARFNGSPAMVVVLPSPIAGKLDVYVVGPGCSRANDSTLFYTSVDKP